MNKLVAETFSILNGLLAILFIVIGGIVGKYMGPFWVQLYAQLNGLAYAGSQSQAETAGIICGLALGFFWAVLVCGLFALFIQMHRELKAIRQQLVDTKPLQAPTSQVRVEPRMPALAA
jgi:hypothetical protein